MQTAQMPSHTQMHQTHHRPDAAMRTDQNTGKMPYPLKPIIVHAWTMNKIIITV